MANTEKLIESIDQSLAAAEKLMQPLEAKAFLCAIHDGAISEAHEHLSHLSKESVRDLLASLKQAQAVIDLCRFELEAAA